MKIKKSFTLLIALLALILVPIFGLFNNKKGIEIYLPSLFPEQNEQFNSNNFIGRPYILNIFNSWCSACKEEHHLWFLIKDKVNLYGISYVDSAIQAQKFLQDNGNPYIDVGLDKRGITHESLNINALPETFIIDKLGKIQLHIIGPINEKRLNHEILPLYNRLLLQE